MIGPGVGAVEVRGFWVIILELVISLLICGALPRPLALAWWVAVIGVAAIIVNSLVNTPVVPRIGDAVCSAIVLAVLIWNRPAWPWRTDRSVLHPLRLLIVLTMVFATLTAVAFWTVREQFRPVPDLFEVVRAALARLTFTVGPVVPQGSGAACGGDLNRRHLGADADRLAGLGAVSVGARRVARRLDRRADGPGTRSLKSLPVGTSVIQCLHERTRHRCTGRCRPEIPARTATGNSPQGAGRLLLPDARIHLRDRRRGAGHDGARLAGAGPIRRPVVAADLALPDRHQRLPRHAERPQPARAADGPRPVVATGAGLTRSAAPGGGLDPADRRRRGAGRRGRPGGGGGRPGNHPAGLRRGAAAPATAAARGADPARGAALERDRGRRAAGLHRGVGEQRAAAGQGDPGRRSTPAPRTTSSR